MLDSCSVVELWALQRVPIDLQEEPTVSCCIGDDVDKCDVISGSEINCDPRIRFIRGAKYIPAVAKFRDLHPIHQHAGISFPRISGTGKHNFVGSNVIPWNLNNHLPYSKTNFFNRSFVLSYMYPENSEGTQVIVGSKNMEYLSDTARNWTHNLFHPKREPISLRHACACADRMICK